MRHRWCFSIPNCAIYNQAAAAHITAGHPSIQGPKAALPVPQVVNHFYGMFELYRKKGLARSLAAMAAEVPNDYTNLTP